MTIKQLSSADEYQTAYIQVAPLRDPEEGMYPFTYWLSYAYDYSDISASKVSFDVPPRAVVLRVVHQVTEALTGATALTIGDDSDADGWMASGVADPSTAGDTALDYDAAYAVKGKYYSSGDTIDISFTGVVTAGSGKIFIEVLSYFEDLTDT